MQTAPKKAWLTYFLASAITALVLGVFLWFVWDYRLYQPNIFYLLVGIGCLAAYSNFRSLTSKYRRREAILNAVFPDDWRNFLEKNVAFYHSLSSVDKIRFEQKVQVFLIEKRITGIKTEVDDGVRLLVAASAIIPIFGFEEWEYDNLGEVLIYPDTFDHDFNQEGAGRNVLGMVGTGTLSNIMILSKPALIAGFANSRDGNNVGIHEFVHLMDAGDGRFDGIPLLLDKPYVIPWLRLIREEILRIDNKRSVLNNYGGTNEVEFLAVASEYFFENPKNLQVNHPELYEMLTKIFHQNPVEQLKYAFHSMIGYTGKKIGRNEACPCKSGEKYKKCCLDKEAF